MCPALLIWAQELRTLQATHQDVQVWKCLANNQPNTHPDRVDLPSLLPPPDALKGSKVSLYPYVATGQKCKNSEHVKLRLPMYTVNYKSNTRQTFPAGIPFWSQDPTILDVTKTDFYCNISSIIQNRNDSHAHLAELLQTFYAHSVEFAPFQHAKVKTITNSSFSKY